MTAQETREREHSPYASPTCPQVVDPWVKGLLAEMLNLSGLDTDANGDVLPIAEDSNLGGQPHTIPFSQRFGETMGATDRHLNGARVILQREGGIPTLPSQFILARTRQMNFALERHQL